MNYEDFLKKNSEFFEKEGRKNSLILNYLLSDSSLSYFPTEIVIDYFRNIYKLLDMLEKENILYQGNIEEEFYALKNLFKEAISNSTQKELAKEVTANFQGEEKTINFLKQLIGAEKRDIKMLFNTLLVTQKENINYDELLNKSIFQINKERLKEIFFLIEKNLTSIHHKLLINPLFEQKFSIEKDIKRNIATVLSKSNRKEFLEKLSKFYQAIPIEQIEKITNLYSKILYSFLSEKYSYVIESIKSKKLFSESTEIKASEFLENLEKYIEEKVSKNELNKQNAKLIKNIFLNFIPYLSIQGEKGEKGLALSIKFQEPYSEEIKKNYVYSHYYHTAKIYNANRNICNMFTDYDNYKIYSMYLKGFNIFTNDVLLTENFNEEAEHYYSMFTYNYNENLKSNNSAITEVMANNNDIKELDTVPTFSLMTGGFPLIHKYYSDNKDKIVIFITEGFKDGENFFNYMSLKDKSVITVSYRSALHNYSLKEIVFILNKEFNEILQYKEVDFVIGGDVFDSRIVKTKEAVNKFTLQDEYIQSYLKHFEGLEELGAGDLHNLKVYEELKKLFSKNYIEKSYEKIKENLEENIEQKKKHLTEVSNALLNYFKFENLDIDSLLEELARVTPISLRREIVKYVANEEIVKIRIPTEKNIKEALNNLSNEVKEQILLNLLTNFSYNKKINVDLLLPKLQNEKHKEFFELYDSTLKYINDNQLSHYGKIIDNFALFSTAKEINNSLEEKEIKVNIKIFHEEVYNTTIGKKIYNSKKKGMDVSDVLEQIRKNENIKNTANVDNVKHAKSTFSRGK